MKTPLQLNISKFTCQRYTAGVRGVKWDLTFEEWWDIWEKSGHYAERGRSKDSYCMSRYGDTGPYSVSNVFIQKFGSNTIDAHKNKAKPTVSIARSNKIRPKITCPYCNKTGGDGAMNRWHFFNCKLKPLERAPKSPCNRSDFAVTF